MQTRAMTAARERPAVGARTTVATANVRYTLDAADARDVLAKVLAEEPDLIGLQEWYPSRVGLLRETGRVGPVPAAGILRLRRRGTSDHKYQWNAPLLGGCAVGARVDRFDLQRCWGVLLSGPGRAERTDRPFGLEPPRLASVAVYSDLQLGRTFSLIDFHLSSGVQRGGSYRVDRPQLVKRHQREARRLQELVQRLISAGHVVHAVGDSNFDGFRLRGLTSAWEGRAQDQGTLGASRKVDDVHGPGPAERVQRLGTLSDHHAVLVSRTSYADHQTQ
jgi:hypothetical protein